MLQDFCKIYTDFMNDKLPDLLKRNRKMMGLTLKQAGLKCGVHSSQLSRFEKETFSSRPKNLQKYCKFLHVDLSIIDANIDSLLFRCEKLARTSMDNQLLINSFLVALESNPVNEGSTENSAGVEHEDA